MGKRHTSRQIKLHPRHRALSWGRYKIVPWLTLSGVWLETLGFHAGEWVRITTRERLLIIEPLEGSAEELRSCRSELREVKRTLKELSK